ncbi:MAG: hypothetical protein GY760_24745 [Deltaproteobacteria bacterium]|nr:hypothetical protein [Deltaproteobacteria bacterium]
MIFFENLETTQDLAAAEEKPWPGGEGIFAVSGTPDGLIVDLYANIEGTGYTAITGGQLSNTTGQYKFTLPKCDLKAVVTGSAGLSSNISCTVSGTLDK